MIHHYSADYDNVRLRPLLDEDVEQLRLWRNDLKVTKFLRNIGYITTQMQKDWFETYKSNNKEISFAIIETECLNRIVGSISLYDINGKTAEIGRIQIGDTEAHGKGIGQKALVMAMWIGFSKLGLEKIVSEVHQENLPAHRNHMKVGFKIVGTQSFYAGGMEDKLEMTKQMLLNKNNFIPEIKL